MSSSPISSSSELFLSHSPSIFEEPPANQLADPEIRRIYDGYGFPPSQQESNDWLHDAQDPFSFDEPSIRPQSLPPIIEDDTQSFPQITGATQGFQDFVDGHQDTILTSEFTCSLVKIVHDGVYDGPDHLISKEVYQGLENSSCPYCRRGITAVTDISKNVRMHLNKWKDVRFENTGDNALHKALKIKDSSLYFTLFKLPGVGPKLFEPNNDDLTPFQLLCDKPEIKEAFDQEIPSIDLPDGVAFSYVSYKESLLITSKGNTLFKSIGDQVTLNSGNYTIKALDFSTQSPQLYLLDSSENVVKINGVSIDPTFSVKFSMAKGIQKVVSTTLPLLIGRDPNCGLVVSNLIVSRRHWSLELNKKGQVVLAEMKVLNPSRLTCLTTKEPIIENEFIQPIPVVIGDEVYIEKERIFTFGGIEIESKERRSRKRPRSLTTKEPEAKKRRLS